MIVIGFECQTPCPACGTAIPINALVPAVYCAACTRIVNLSPAGVAEMLKQALAAPGAMQMGTGARGSVWSPDGQFELAYTRMGSRCEFCGMALPVDQAVGSAQGGWVWCAGCKVALSVRPVPSPLAGALPGVSHLIGEDAEQLAAAGAASFAARQGAPIPCGQCGGALEVDGSSRNVTCGYCSAPVVIPDDVWVRLHPAQTVRRWFAVIAGGAEPVFAQPAQAPVNDDWFSIYQACADDGAVYCSGNRDSEQCVWALDARTLRTKWLQKGLGFEHGISVTLTTGGDLLAWQKDASEGKLFNCADGLPKGPFGRLEPPGNSVHQLDFVQLDGFASDADGTFFGSFKGRLLRFDASGSGVPTWPQATGMLSFLKTKQKDAPLWIPMPNRPTDDLDKNDYDTVRQRLAYSARKLGFNWMDYDLAKLGDRPLFLAWNARIKINVGWDGHLLCLGDDDGNDKVLVRFDREGKRTYVAVLPLDDFEWGARPHAAGDGTAFVLGELDHKYKLLVRVAVNGTATQLVKDKQLGGPLLEDDDAIAVSPSGVVYVIGRRGSVKAFGSDGQVIAMSDAARKQLGV